MQKEQAAMIQVTLPRWLWDGMVNLAQQSPVSPLEGEHIMAGLRAAHASVKEVPNANE